MRVYRYRWLCAIVCALMVLLVGYVVDLQVFVEEHAALVASESDIHEQINLHQHLSVTPDQAIVDRTNFHSSLLRDVFNAIDATNIELLSLTQAMQGEASGADSEYYRLVIAAQYPSFIRMLQRLSNPPGKYSIGDFAISENDGGHIQVSLMLRIVSGVATDHLISPIDKALINPFCAPLERILTQRVMRDEAVKFSLEHLRLLGVVCHAKTKEAVVLFPDGVIAVVANQARLGSEGGKVSLLSDHSLVVTLPDQTRHVLTVSRP